MTGPPPTLLTIEEADLLDIFNVKYRQTGSLGPGPALRLRYGHFSPDDYYEAVVSKLVNSETTWADIGCGRQIFPSNRPLAKALADRCSLLYGIDPDDNIKENPLLHEYFQGTVEKCQTAHRFDLVTLRMVAEHIADPAASIKKIVSLLKPGGLMVVYTPNCWSPMSIAAAITPFSLHNPIKRLLWKTDKRDTFPTVYRLNTRKDLVRHTQACGLKEVHLQYLDDCRTFAGYRMLNIFELKLQRHLKALGLRYPENCILGIYQNA